MPDKIEQLERDLEDAQEAQNRLREELEEIHDQLLSHAHKGGSDGVPVKVKVRQKSGAWTASELKENEIGIDSSNGRLYFVYGGAVHYCLQDA